jgi:hypothetical protein
MTAPPSIVERREESKGAEWYAGYGAVALEDSPLTLMLPLATIEGALRAAER